MKKLLSIIPILFIAGCLSSDDDLKNFGGNTGTSIVNPSNTITIAAYQPENPNQSAEQEILFNTDGSLLSITQRTGGAFKNGMGKLKGMLSLSRLCMIGGMICAVIGGIILSLPISYSNKIGWTLVGCGSAFGVFGAILPSFGTYFFIFAVVGGAIGVGYMLIQRKHDNEVVEALHSPQPNQS